ncbi:MAG TPA: alkaline phosphatase family protein [Ktedonobacteraceae bacterium]|nr:alkaline phosphatase family protein [Ktedonobacteraceae bacterium]
MRSRSRFFIGFIIVVVLLPILFIVPRFVQAHTAGTIQTNTSRAPFKGSPLNSHQRTSRTLLHGFQHVFVIVMENNSYSSIIGNANAPWITSAAKTYGIATRYYGVAHPSQPNYLALTSGSTQGVASDATVTVRATNLVDQLEAHGKSWKAYMQSLSSRGNINKLAPSVGGYARKHNPFVSYTDIQRNPARMARIVDFSQLATDLRSDTVPDFAWITPDLCHDMHGITSSRPNDPCSNPRLLVAQGDTFLRTTVDEIMHSRAWSGNSVIFIAWDESNFNDQSGCCNANPGGGHVLTLVISRNERTPRSSNVLYNHYSLLATIENGWGLSCLNKTCGIARIQSMNALVGSPG